MLVLTSLLGTASIAATNNDLYYRVGKVTAVPLFEETTQSTPVMGQCDSKSTTNPQDASGDLDEIGVIVDKIINIGKKIWGVIEAGRPVVNVKTDVAHALPAGIHCWSDLENWQAPQSKSWKVTYENQLGGKVVEFVYRVSYIAGGQYKGVGRYVTQATISPAEIYVAWGYTFNVEASVPSVFNVGTQQNPVAGMQMNVKWTVDTAINHHQKDIQFYINGLGEFQKMQSEELF